MASSSILISQSQDRQDPRLNVFCRIKATSKVLLDCVSLGCFYSKKSISRLSSTSGAQKEAQLVNLSSFFTAKFLFEQVHAVQKQYFLGSIIHTGFLRFGLRKLLAAGLWGIWQLQRITCIMTRLSKASPRHHSACSQENQKSTCAVEGFFSHSLKPSPERIEIL